MIHGTFANIRIRNEMAPGTEGGVTTYVPENKIMSIYDAAMKYQAIKIPTVIVAGKEYGTGSSRDWAAKGPMLLGVKAVIAARAKTLGRIFNNHDMKALSQLRTFRSDNAIPDPVFLIGIKSKSAELAMNDDILKKLVIARSKSEAKDLLDATEIGAINVKEFISARPRPHNPMKTPTGSVTVLGEIPIGLLQKKP